MTVFGGIPACTNAGRVLDTCSTSVYTTLQTTSFRKEVEVLRSFTCPPKSVRTEDGAKEEEYRKEGICLTLQRPALGGAAGGLIAWGDQALIGWQMLPFFVNWESV